MKGNESKTEGNEKKMKEINRKRTVQKIKENPRKGMEIKGN